jgi:class 3 adenylate cyclase
MAKSTHRTLVCSVLVFDIVEYALRSSGEQTALQERLDAALTEAIAGVTEEDCIVLQTEGGAALGFLENPEDAMFAGISVCKPIAEQEATAGTRAWIRAGINLGPVGLAKGRSRKPAIVGDGIEAAQCIMLFAEPGQILVSRSYRDVMVRVSDGYVDLFDYKGEKFDKNDREHWVYAVGPAPRSLFRDRGTKADNARRSLGRMRANATRSAKERRAMGRTGAIVAWMRNLFR